MKKVLTLLFCAALAAGPLWGAAKSKAITVQSPDKRTTVSIDGFKYSVKVDGVTLLSPSEVGMTLADGTVYGGKARLQKKTVKSYDTTASASVYKKSSVRNRYTELTLSYKDFDLIFRVYNEGVAYRFVSKAAKKFKVTSEKVEFAFPDDSKCFVPYCNSEEGASIEEQTACSFENTYKNISLKEWDPERTAFLPVLVVASNGYKIAITEADLFSYPGLHLANTDSDCTLEGILPRYPKVVKQGGHNMLQGRIVSREDYLAECKGSRAFPWRVMQIAREDKELCDSDMVFNLATPADESKDWSWVKPGKVAWDWWNAWNIRGVDFKSGINNDTYKYYIDFAAANNIEYVILDEGWAVKGKADLMQIVPEINLEEICGYAASKGVGIILWAGYWAVNRNIEEVFLHYHLMGVKGFKIDFMDRDDAQMVDFYTACAQMGAKHHMLVDFHGAYKPTGLQRTYPNVINFEGVHGLEQMKWSQHADQVTYDVTIPFIRMMAGPMDYTQGAMRNATKKNYRPISSEAMSQGTRCRQLAEYVIFDAPFSMLCDSPSNYLDEPECTKYIAEIPTVWDETIALRGEVGKFVMMARRSGDTWYAGALTDWEEKDITLDLNFLPAGTFEAEIYRDGINADKCASDFKIETKSVSCTDNIKLHLAPGGGFAVKFTKK